MALHFEDDQGGLGAEAQEGGSPLGEAHLRVLILVPLLLLSACVSIAPGPRDDASPPERGRLLAAQRCAICHDVSRHGFSRDWRAPKFRDIEGSPEAVRAFAADLRLHHEDGMPQIILTSDQARDLYAYMESLRRPDPNR